MNPAFLSPVLRARSLPLVAILAITPPQLDAFAYGPDVKPSSASGSTDKPAPPAAAIDRPASTDGGTAVQVRNVRLEADPAAGASPSSTLKFEMLNDGSTRLTNIVVEVSVVKDDKEAPAAAGDVVVRPFIVREKVVLQPGYSIEYEVRFQNLAGNCGCAARVKVVSAESIVDSR